MNGYNLGIQDLGSAAGAERYRLINWTTFGTSQNVTGARLISNTTYARSSLPTFIDWNVGYGATVSGISTQAVYSGMTVLGFNVKTGEQLWNQTLAGVTQYSGSCNVADHRKIAVLTEQGYMMAWDLYSGKLAWQSDPFDYPWAEPGFGAYGIASAYGLVIRNSYDGIYAFNWSDGSLAWKYKAYAWSPYETPYIDENGQTVYSWNVDSYIVDGKYYAYNTEHSATNPITRGWSMHCINCTTGEKIWSVALPGASSKHETDIGAIADGYLTLFGSDGYLYCFGKGKSATTVTAPDVVMPNGNGIVIKGTVLDMSPAQPNTPAVSKDSMALQMEYVHKQMPINGIWGNETVTGVPVTLTAIGSDGTVIDIGTVTTNGYYGTFSMAWTPPNEGTYEILASFAGDDSYGSSSAATAVSVGPAPEPITFPEQPTPADYTMLFNGLIAAVIIAIAIGVVNLAVHFRKHP